MIAGPTSAALVAVVTADQWAELLQVAAIVVVLLGALIAWGFLMRLADRKGGPLRALWLRVTGRHPGSAQAVPPAPLGMERAVGSQMTAVSGRRVGLAVGEVEAFKTAHLVVDPASVQVWLAATGAPVLYGTSLGSASCALGEPHVAPDVGCTCGFHGLRSEREAWARRRRRTHAGLGRPAVVAQVALSGRVLQFRSGFRAQRQRVVQATVAAGCVVCGRQAQLVAGQQISKEGLRRTSRRVGPLPVAGRVVAEPHCRRCGSQQPHVWTLQRISVLLGVPVRLGRLASQTATRRGSAGGRGSAAAS